MADYIGNKGTIQIFPNGSQRFWRYRWEITDVDYINLTSTFHWTVSFVDTVGGYAINRSESGYVTTDYGTENEQRVNWSGQIRTNGTAGEWLFKEGTHTIQHDSSGYKTNMQCIFYASWNGYTTQSTPTITLDRISAQPSITDVTDAEGNTTLYDDSDFVITYTNPAGTQVDSLQAGITFDLDADMDVDYVDIPKDGTSYTFSLTDVERQAIWSHYSAATSNRFYFLVKVVFQGVTYTDYITATINLRDYELTIEPTVVDINSDTLRLTGDNKTLVRYMSDAYYEVNAKPIKGAAIIVQFVRNGNTYTEPTGTIPAVESNTFYFGASDSRGSSVNSAVVFNNLADLKWIEYIKLTTNIKSIQLNSDGSFDITIAGKYFNGNFGQADNKFTVDYEVHASDSEAGSWESLGVVSPTVDSDGSYTYSFTLRGYDYLTRYVVSIKVSDELMTSDTASKTIAAKPVFDWGEYDFKFNVPVNMTGGFTYPQRMIWSGTSQLGDGETVTLDYPISSQPTGIVLVFSLYRDNAAEDVSINSFFVSKAEVVHLLSGAPHLFMMGINSNLSVFGSKYIYIEDDKLTGFSGNTAVSTAASGIAFNNSNFVLRYVIGV